jgi:lactate permease
VPWNQNYNPLHFWPASTFVSALPVLTLFFVLLILKKRVWVSALCGMIMAILLAALVFQMPVSLIANACIAGVVFGLDYCRIHLLVPGRC